MSRAGPPVAAWRVSRKARTGYLRRQDLDQEHVGPARRQLERELIEQGGLERADADDEEAPDPDGEQNHAGLVARTREIEHRVAEREPAGARHRVDRLHDRGRGNVQRQGDTGEPCTDDQAQAHRTRLP